jgi:hypothetical protein
MESLTGSRVSRTLNVFCCAVALVAPLGAPTPLRAASPATKIPLDYPAYDTYAFVRGTTISDDGRYAAYVLAPEDGDPTLVIHDFSSGTDVREPRGTSPRFTADSHALVYTLRAPNDEIRKATLANKKPSEFPPSGLGIVDLATGKNITIDLVKSVAVPRDIGSTTIAYARATPTPVPSGAKPSASAAASPTPAASATPSAALSPGPSPSATASPDDLHKKSDGNDLVIRDLTSAHEVTIAHVDGYVISHDGAYVAYATQSKDGKNDALWIRASAAGSEPVRLSLGAGHYRALSFAPKSESLAFASDAATFSDPAPRYAYFVVDAASSAPPALAPVLAAGTSGLPAGWAPSTAATPAFSKDTRYLYVGTAPAPTPVPSGTPTPLPVDIWNWHDVDLQSVQRHDADDERTRTYRAAIDLQGHTVAQLGTPAVRDIETTLDPGATFALGRDDGPYRRAASWREDRSDLYAISLSDGARRRIVQAIHDDASFAPTGRFVATYDRRVRAWYATRLRDGKRVDLTTKLHLPFYDERDDHPDDPPPYAFQGWLDGDRAALVSDRYDVWAIDPDTGSARALTLGRGRKAKIRYSLHELDPDATSFSSSAPILAEGLDDATKDRELWTIAIDPNTHAVAMREFAREPKAFQTFARARYATRFVTGETSFAEPFDLYASAAVGEPLSVLSDANPQMAHYRMGTERLISYKSRTGVPLRGILFEPTPDGSRAKRPMLVYFYERFSDDLHQMYFTEPGPGTSPNLLRYVSHGYDVFVPDIAYRSGHPGESAYDCIMPGVDAAIAAGHVDPARIGIAGHSWAAYQIAYLITRTNRFRAAEAGAAVANMTSAYGGIRLESGNVRESQYEVGQSRIGATPWDRPDLYLENSALFHVRNVHTPYLTIANDTDGAVPFLQGIEFFTALRRLDKEAYLFEFDGEKHNLVNRENQKYWTVHLDEFFDHFLLGTPAPAWMTQGVDFLHRGERDVRSLYGEKP